MITEIISAVSNNNGYFTVDNTKGTVPVLTQYAQFGYPYIGVSGEKFDIGDNINLLSMIVSAPKNYVIENVTNVVNANFIIRSYQQHHAHTNLFSTKLGFFNYENSIGQFLDFNEQIGVLEKYLLELFITGLGTVESPTSTLNISMLNVPNSENGKTYYLQSFLKIQHTIEMSE